MILGYDFEYQDTPVDAVAKPCGEGPAELRGRVLAALPASLGYQDIVCNDILSLYPFQ